MSTSPFVTVVVPVYNVSTYIERCARSLFEQTLDNIEIIFIDDCSPDDSIEIIKSLLNEYPKRIKQTRIIKMPTNVGLAGVRWQGIIEATGKYIIHCDGDDWVDLTLFEMLYSTAIKDSADIVVCDLIDYYGDRYIRRKQQIYSNDTKTLLANWYCRTMHMSCCNKLVKKTIYDNNSISPWFGLNMWEDNGLISRVFYFASKISYVSDAAYYYNRTNINAITSGYGIKQIEQMISIATHLSTFFDELNDCDRFRKTSDAFKYLARINLITDSFKNYKRFKKTFPECKYIAQELDKRAFSAKGRFRFLMVKSGLAPLFILMFKLKKLLTK